MKVIDLFSGIGGFSLAAEWAGFETALFCERDKFCKKVLHKHWPDVPIHDDVTTLASQLTNYIDPNADDFILTGGFPCQPFSVAGKQRGKSDDRYLWPAMLEVIQAARPRWIIGENVAGIIELALDDVCAALETEGYETEAIIIPACAVGAPHRRDRVWIIGYTNSGVDRNSKTEIFGHTSTANKIRATTYTESARREGCTVGQREKQLWRSGEPSYWGDRNWRQALADFHGMGNGVPNRVDRLRALGNAIVPQVAYQIFEAIKQIENESNPNDHFTSIGNMDTASTDAGRQPIQ